MQASLCAIQVGMVELLRHFGVKPTLVIGHSVGEVAAAYASGHLNLKDVVNIIYHRGHQLAKTTGKGSMVAVLHCIEDVLEHIKHLQTVHEIQVAAINSPTQIVLSGDHCAINALCDHFRKNRIPHSKLRVGNAFHSSQQDGIKHSFTFNLGPLEGVGSQECIPMISTVTGNYVTGHELVSADHWWLNIRQKVSFQKAIEKALSDGIKNFIEIGPHPLLCQSILEILDKSSQNSAGEHMVIGTLQRPKDLTYLPNDMYHFLASLGQLHCRGFPVDFKPLFQHKYVVQSRPSLPWQNTECNGIPEFTRNILFPRMSHPTLGRCTPMPNDPKGMNRWSSNLMLSHLPWITDHNVQGDVTIPAALYIENAIEAARQDIGQYPIKLINVAIKEVIQFNECKTPELQTTLMDNLERNNSIAVYGKQQGQPWQEVLHGQVEEMNRKNREDLYMPINEITARLATKSNLAGCNKTTPISEHSLLGNAFKSMDEMFMNDTCTESLCKILAPILVSRDIGDYSCHPALLQAIFHSCILLGKEYTTRHNMNLSLRCDLFNIKAITMYQAIQDNVLVHMKMNSQDLTFDITIVDPDTFKILCECIGIDLKSSSPEGDCSGMEVWREMWEEISFDKTVQNVSNSQTKITLLISDEKTLSAAKSDIMSDQQVDILYVPDYQVRDKDISNLSACDVLVVFFSNENTADEKSSLDMQHFRGAVEKTSLYGLKIVKKLISLYSRGKFPHIIFVTEGAFSIRDNDVPSPHLASVISLVLSCMHEVPEVPMSTIDLPKDHLFPLVMETLPRTSQLMMYENELAIRLDENGSVHFYAHRMERSLPLQCTYPCKETPWAVEINEKTNHMKVVDDSHQPSGAQDELQLELDCFTVHGLANDWTSIVAGRVTYIAQDETHGSLRLGDNVLAADIKSLSKITAVNKCNAVKIPGKFSCKRALNLVNNNLLGHLILNGCWGCRANDVFLVIDKDCSRHSQATVEILCRAGHTVHFVKTVSSLNGVDPIDFVIIFQAQQEELELLPLVMRQFGTVAFATHCVRNQIHDLSKVTNVKLLLLDISTIEKTLIHQTILNILRECEEERKDGASGSNDTSKLLPLSKVDQMPLDANRGSIYFADKENMEIHLTFKGGLFVAESRAEYIVTGGSRGLGLSLVEWLCQKGAKNVSILCRNLPEIPESDIIQSLKNAGATVTIYQVDISNSDDVRSVIKEICQNGKPIEGIFHSAVAYRDALLSNMTDEGWMQVMLTKAYAACTLHHLSLELKLPLKYFVLVSSMTALLGGYGQSNYCAANIYLNSIAEERNRHGLPATVINYGVINSVGYSKRHGLVEKFENQGITSTSPDMATRALDTMMMLSNARLGIIPSLSMETFSRTHRGLVDKHFALKEGILSRMKNIGLTEQSYTDSNTKGIFQGDQLGVEQELLISLAKLEIAESDKATPLIYLGLDSFMAGEVSSIIWRKFAVDISPVEVLNDQITIQKLAEAIVLPNKVQTDE